MDMQTILGILGVGLVASVGAQEPLETEGLATSGGEVTIAFIGHGSLRFTFQGKVIHVDPYGKLTDYGKQPKADLLLLTHEHPDHLDADAIRKVRTEKTVVVLPAVCADKVSGGVVMKNGDVRDVQGIRIEAVPAYNRVHTRSDGQPYHPKGVGNGYILTFGDRRVYVAGDTENTPEMKALSRIDVAFLPMNLPYTMTPEMVAAAAKVIRPRILYPYHFGDSDTSKLVALLKDEKWIEVRVREMK